MACATVVAIETNALRLTIAMQNSLRCCCFRPPLNFECTPDSRPLRKGLPATEEEIFADISTIRRRKT